MTKLIGDGRVLKVCDVCGGVDDHPRHMLAGSTTGIFEPVDPAIVAAVAANAAKVAPEAECNRLIADLLDQSSQERHMDCCATTGCPTGACDEVIHAAGSRRGAALLAHIQKGTP